MKTWNDHEFFIRAYSGQLSTSEKKEFEMWLEASSENQKVYQEFTHVWGEMKPPEPPVIPDIKKEWKSLEDALHLSSPGVSKQSRWKSIESWSLQLNGFGERRIRIAGVVMVSVLILFMGYTIWKSYSHRSQIHEIITLNRQMTHISLSDGSSIQLNHGSRIQFQESFTRSERLVTLLGEGFFEVIPDKRPFVVATENAKVIVLGTRFNVWSRREKTRVIVQEGRVHLESKEHPEQKIILMEDQMGQIKGKENPPPPESVDANYLIGWMDGRLVFEKMTLSEVVQEIERFYDVEIVVENSQFLSQTLTANFEESKLETVLSSLCLTLGAEYQFEAGKYWIQ